MRRHDPELDRRIGENLKRIRCARGTTRAELGATVHVSRQQVSKYENGQDSLSVAIAADMCGHLDTPLDMLIDGTLADHTPLLTTDQAFVAKFHNLLDKDVRQHMTALYKALAGFA